jgi:hypothetical protein
LLAACGGGGGSSDKGGTGDTSGNGSTGNGSSGKGGTGDTGGNGSIGSGGNGRSTGNSLHVVATSPTAGGMPLAIWTASDISAFSGDTNGRIFHYDGDGWTFMGKIRIKGSDTFNVLQNTSTGG